MGRRKSISIASNDQRRRFQSRNSLCPIIILTHSIPHFSNKTRKIFWPWRNAHIVIMYGSANKELMSDGSHTLLNFGIPATTFEGCGDKHKFVDQLWMADSN